MAEDTFGNLSIRFWRVCCSKRFRLGAFFRDLLFFLKLFFMHTDSFLSEEVQSLAIGGFYLFNLMRVGSYK
jgi:hypothetical protein